MKRALLCLAYTIGVRKGVVDERLNVAQINIGRAPSGGSNNFNLREFTYDCLKVLNGFIHFIANMAKEAILETSTDFYAVPAETESAILTLWSANHINKYHHCEMYTHSKSQFTRDFNLTKALLDLTELTFQDSSDYEIVKEGFNYRHGEFYLYKFNVDRIIGYSIEAEQLTKHIGIFYTYRPCDGDQFNIVTAFPY